MSKPVVTFERGQRHGRGAMLFGVRNHPTLGDALPGHCTLTSRIVRAYGDDWNLLRVETENTVYVRNDIEPAPPMSQEMKIAEAA